MAREIKDYILDTVVTLGEQHKVDVCGNECHHGFELLGCITAISNFETKNDSTSVCGVALVCNIVDTIRISGNGVLIEVLDRSQSVMPVIKLVSKKQYCNQKDIYIL